MDEHAIFAFDFVRKLTGRFNEELVFEVADSPADFYQDDIRIFAVRHFVEMFLDSVRHMRNELNRMP